MTLTRKIKQALRRFISVMELTFCRPISTDKDFSDHRIVVLQDCHVGDFLVALPFFQRMSKYYDQKLTLISDRRIEPLAMACGCFEEVIAVDMKHASSYKHLFYRRRVLRSLRKLSAKVLIQKYSVGGTSLEDCMAAVIFAQEKIGVDSEKTDSNGGGKFYGDMLRKKFDRLYKYDPQKTLLQNENAFCNMVCQSSELDCVGNLDCFEPLPERDKSLGDYALFIVGADDPRRRWEPEKFAAVAEKFLQKNPDKKILFSGSPSEHKIIAEVVKKIPEAQRNQISVRSAEVDYLQAIKRLMSDCKHAEFVLVGETGPLHIAAKFKTRCYCLSGGWHYGVFAPWQEYTNTTYFQERCKIQPCNGDCKYNTIPFKCLQELAAEKVWGNL